jgi:hypothetical protein
MAYFQWKIEQIRPNPNVSDRILLYLLVHVGTTQNGHTLDQDDYGFGVHRPEGLDVREERRRFLRSVIEATPKKQRA